MNDWKEIAAAVSRIDRAVERLLEAQDKVAVEWYSVAQAAATTGLSATTIRRAIAGRELAASNVGGQRRPVWRISRDDLAAWMERKKGGTHVVPPRGELGELVSRYFGPSGSED